MMPKQKPKTRWGFLICPILLAVVLTYAAIHDAWDQSRPVEVHLRDIFKESGFQVPDDVSEIHGRIGHKDGQGDFGACVTFQVHADQIGQFMNLSSRGWRQPDDFKPWKDPHTFSTGDPEIVAPAGTFIIEQWGPGEYMSRYGVNKTSRTIFFERSSW